MEEVNLNEVEAVCHKSSVHTSNILAITVLTILAITVLTSPK